MTDLKAYLDKPPQLQLYSEGTVLFTKYAMIHHADKWPQLNVGPFGTNKDVLMECLQAVYKAGPQEAVKAPAVVKVTAVPDRPQAFAKTNLEVDVLLQLRKLRQKRSKTSQRFHDCEDDASRALICDVIEAINTDIKKVQEELAYIQRYGKQRPKEIDKDTPLPEDKDGLKKALNRCSSNILKVERRIDFLLGYPENSRKRKQLTGRQEILNHLIARRMSIRKKLRDLKKQTDG